MAKRSEEATIEDVQVSDKIFTVPNVISFIRLCLVPVFFVLLMNGYNLVATLLYALAAGTDWVDGQIARRTNQVSTLGQLLDPAVDRILMISGVLGLFLVGRLPLWIILFAGLLLNWPVLPGLGIVDVAWLPGFNADACSWGIWFVYAGLVLALATTAYYIASALRQLREAKGATPEGGR